MTQSHNTTELPPALEAPRKDFKLSSGIRLCFYSDGDSDGAPLVLVHSVNAAPSAIEMKPLFEHYRNSRPVLAPELPGFGASDRRNIEYTPDFYADALCEWMTATLGAAADVVALSLSSEFAARAAQKAPQLFRSLTFLSPTGFGRRQPPGDAAGRRIDRFLGGNLIGPGLFRLLTTKPSIGYFLNMSFIDRAPQALVDYAYQTSHRDGAHYAPFAFLSGRLFTRDAVAGLYESLRQPVMVLYDTDPNISFEHLDGLVARRDNWTAQRIAPSRGLPHFDQREQTIHALDRFWAEAEDRASNAT